MDKKSDLFRQTNYNNENKKKNQALTFCLDGCCVDREVGVPGQILWPDDVLAEAACYPCQASSLQVESLSRLHGELGAATVPQGQTVGALVVQT